MTRARSRWPRTARPLPLEPFVGVLEMHPNGYGFLRDPKNNYTRERTDPFVPGTMIEKYRLREGVLINGMMQQDRRQQGPRLREIIDVDGMPPDDYAKVKDFDSLTPINPDQWLRLETGPQPLTTRVMDLLTPIGKGQRALIVAPPRTGKTILLQHISQAIAANYPGADADHAADRRAAGRSHRHAPQRRGRGHRQQPGPRRRKPRAALAAGRRALPSAWPRWARTCSCSWTRSPAWPAPSTSGSATPAARCRAASTSRPSTCPRSCSPPPARSRKGGSLTIVATALIDTGSRMDEVIFQEFKGTGNMELVLDRKLADRRVFPAIDITPVGHAARGAAAAARDAARGDDAPPHADRRCTRSMPWSN